MSGKRIAVFDPQGKFATIDESDLDKLPDGARQLTKQENKERELAAAYDKKSTTDKVVNAVLGQGIGPRSEAFLESGRHVMSAGVSQAATKLAIDKVKQGAGAAYAEHLDDLETAHPDASTAGAAVGTVGQVASAFVGGGAGLARALPGAGVSALGAGAEGLAARGLGGLAARGIAGRAAATGIELGVRGAVEGAALGGVEEASREVVHDPNLSADKIFASIGTGALFGGATGAGLGVVGSLGKSAVSGAARAIARRGETAAAGAAERSAVSTADELVGSARTAPFIDPDAGLAGGKFATENPIAIGAEMRPMQLRPGGAIRKVPTEPAFGLRGRLTFDPNAGLEAGEEALKRPFSIGEATQPSPSSRLGEAIGEADKAGRHGGLVPISDLRARFPDMSPADFEKMITDADAAGHLSMKAADARKGLTGGIERVDQSRSIADRALADKLAESGAAAPSPSSTYNHWVVSHGFPEGAAADGEIGVSRSLTTKGKVAIESPSLLGTYEPAMIDAEAGIARRGQNGAFQGTIPTEPALRPSSAKTVPRRVGLDVGGEVPQLGGEVSPIRFPSAAADETASAVAPKSWMARKADELAFDALGGTKGQMTKAVEHVKGGAEAVGEYINRVHLSPAAAGADGMLGAATSAGKVGRADQLLAAIQADKSTRISKGLEGAIRGTPARFDLDTLTKDIANMHETMLRDPTRAAGADAFVGRIHEEIAAIGRTPGRIAADGSIDAADAFQIRAALERKAYEVGGGTNSSAKDAYKQVLRQMDGHVVDTLDKAAADAGKGGVGDEIRHWKREWQLASAAEKVAEGGTERVRGNNTFGIRESIGGLVGLATGNPILGIATAIGGKIARERGSAAGAALLNHMATSRGLASIVERADTKLNAAAHGLLSDPARRPLPFASESPRVVAQTALRQVAGMMADPTGTAQQIADHVNELSASHPELAQAIVARQVNALGFLASKAPSGGDPDPLDPHAAPRMTDGEAATFAKYAFYTQKPDRFFDELEHGKITYEGAETARALMPDAFAELQARTADALATHMTRGRAISYQQRQKLGDMLDIAATPSQRTEHAQFLQAQFVATMNQKPPAAGGMAGSGGKTPTGALDRLSGGIGKR